MIPANFLPQFTERLILRRFIDNDLEPFLIYRQDLEVARFQGWSIPSRHEALSFIQEVQTAELGSLGEWFQIAIAHRHSNILLGDIGIQIYAEAPTTVEIGFTITPLEQNKGYATEAVTTLIEKLFEIERINKVIGITDIRNVASANLLRRLGMHLEKSDSVEFRGEICIEQTFALTKQYH
jgi:RimJ/RimL family protein N-acetyltransferase